MACRIGFSDFPCMSCHVTPGIVVMTAVYVIMMTVAHACFSHDVLCQWWLKQRLSSQYTSCSLLMAFRIGLNGFSSIPFHALAVCLELRSFLPMKDFFFILESIPYFLSNLILKYVQYQLTNNSINPHPSCSVSIAFLADKQTTCFTTDIIIENKVWPLEI